MSLLLLLLTEMGAVRVVFARRRKIQINQSRWEERNRAAPSPEMGVSNFSKTEPDKLEHPSIELRKSSLESNWKTLLPLRGLWALLSFLQFLFFFWLNDKTYI